MSDPEAELLSVLSRISCLDIDEPNGLVAGATLAGDLARLVEDERVFTQVVTGLIDVASRHACSEVVAASPEAAPLAARLRPLLPPTGTGILLLDIAAITGVQLAAAKRDSALTAPSDVVSVVLAATHAARRRLGDLKVTAFSLA